MASTIQTKLFPDNANEELMEFSEKHGAFIGKLWQREELLLVMLPYNGGLIMRRKLFENIKIFEELFPEDGLVRVETASALKRQLHGATEEKEVQAIGKGFKLTEKGISRAKEAVRNAEILGLQDSWNAYLKQLNAKK